MPSSNSSINLWFSTRVLLLLLFLGCFRPSSSAALPTHAGNRWRRPCDGSTPIYAMFIKTTDEALKELSSSSTRLKIKVNDLKNDYVNVRFGGESYAEEERVDSGLVITGSPTWNASNDNMNQTLLVCYENLARLAVLTRLTKEAEETAPGNRDFARRFQGIEDHTESGLYVILCKLYVLMYSLGIEVMSTETEAEVASISFKEAPNNAIRHIRDYTVLLVLENSADQLSSRFVQLVRVV